MSRVIAREARKAAKLPRKGCRAMTTPMEPQTTYHLIEVCFPPARNVEKLRRRWATAGEKPRV